MLTGPIKTTTNLISPWTETHLITPESTKTLLSINNQSTGPLLHSRKDPQSTNRLEEGASLPKSEDCLPGTKNHNETKGRFLPITLTFLKKEPSKLTHPNLSPQHKLTTETKWPEFSKYANSYKK